MTRKQAIFIICVNALLSTLISLCVVSLFVLPDRLASGGRQPVSEVLVQGTANAGQAVEVSAAEEAAVPATSTPVIYVVEPGDTISSLSLKFNVPEADIIAANQIQNPDYLVAGLELAIPVGGLPPATATWTPIPTATQTPLPFEPPSAELTRPATQEAGEPTAASLTTAAPVVGDLRVEITEITGVGDVGLEKVGITNVSDQVADMTGWTLANPDGHTYIFPNYRLWPGGTVEVHTGIGQDGDPISSLFWGRLEPVWVPGELATLRNADGVTLATHAVIP